MDNEVRQENTPTTRQDKQRLRRRSFRRAVPFFTTMALVTVIAWLLPLRPRVSDAEKRELTAFPAFSVRTLFDGSYFKDIDAWFSDTFTFRDQWIGAAQDFKGLYGMKTVAIYGDAAVSDAVPATVPTPAPRPTLAPATAAPAAAETTAPTEEPVTEPEEPAEPEWGGEEIGEDDFVGLGKVLQIGDAAYKITVFVQSNADKFAALMGKAAEKLDGRSQVYCLVVPENTTAMVRAEDRLKYGCVLEEDVLAYMYSQMDPRVIAVDPIPELVAHNNEYIAFRTDHHWTAVGAYYAYVAWCKEAGVEPVPLSEYEEVEWPGFLGTYYYKANQNNLMGRNPDTVFAYVPPGDVHMYLDFNVSADLGKEYDLLFDMSKASAGGKYSTFLGSDRAKVTFVNNDITDGSACLVLKTSFGNPFVYYLTQHYQYVYVLDIRYTNSLSLERCMNTFEFDDILFVLGTGAAESRGGVELVDWFINRRK